MSGNCLESMWGLSVWCGEAVWKVQAGFLEGVGRL